MPSDRPDRTYHTYNHLFLNVSLRSWFTLLVTGVLLVAGACRQQSTIQMEGLYGKWDIHRALRNGAETPYLRGGYFVIDQNGTMIVNITGTEEKGKFELDNNTLSLDNKKNFVVESLEKDSLSIRYIMNADNIFLFYLTKKLDEVQ